MRRMFPILSLACLGVLWVGGQLLAQEKPKQEPTPNKSSDERLKLMHRRAADIVAVGPQGEKYSILEEPLLRYSDPSREIHDASLWAIGTKGRPHAVMVIEVYDDFVSYEMTGTCDIPKKVDTVNWSWQPKESKFSWVEIPGAPQPADNANSRMRAMKIIARSLKASEDFKGTFQLRLMPQPIHRYADSDAGIIDGVVFVLAIGTNAEILLFIEAQQVEGKPSRWVAGFSRLAGASLEVQYNQKPFWSAPGEYGGTKKDYLNFRKPLTSDEKAVFLSDQ